MVLRAQALHDRFLLPDQQWLSQLEEMRAYPKPSDVLRLTHKHVAETAGGADAFTSVIRTLARKGGGQSDVDGLCGVFSGAPVHAYST